MKKENKAKQEREYKHRCLRCDHRWSSEDEVPKKCPSCKSRKWYTMAFYFRRPGEG